MTRTKSITLPANLPATSLIDLSIVAILYLLPGITHILPVPLYLIDPMRLLVFLTLLTTHRTNSLVLAASLPFLSTLFSGHPIFPKNILIATELSLNVMLFHWIFSKRDSVLVAGSLSILISKVFYYALKFGFISAGILGGALISTSLGYQLIPLILLPLLLYAIHTGINRPN